MNNSCLRKRILAAVMTIVVLVGILPIYTFAEETPPAFPPGNGMTEPIPVCLNDKTDQLKLCLENWSYGENVLSVEEEAIPLEQTGAGEEQDTLSLVRRKVTVPAGMEQKQLTADLTFDIFKDNVLENGAYFTIELPNSLQYQSVKAALYHATQGSNEQTESEDMFHSYFDITQNGSTLTVTYKGETSAKSIEYSGVLHFILTPQLTNKPQEAEWILQDDKDKIRTYQESYAASDDAEAKEVIKKAIQSTYVNYTVTLPPSMPQYADNEITAAIYWTNSGEKIPQVSDVNSWFASNVRVNRTLEKAVWNVEQNCYIPVKNAESTTEELDNTGWSVSVDESKQDKWVFHYTNPTDNEKHTLPTLIVDEQGNICLVSYSMQWKENVPNGLTDFTQYINLQPMELAAGQQQIYYAGNDDQAVTAIVWEDLNESQRPDEPYLWYQENVTLTKHFQPLQFDAQTGTYIIDPNGKPRPDEPAQQLPDKITKQGNVWLASYWNADRSASTLPKMEYYGDTMYLVTYTAAQNEAPTGYMNRTQEAIELKEETALQYQGKPFILNTYEEYPDNTGKRQTVRIIWEDQNNVEGKRPCTTGKGIIDTFALSWFEGHITITGTFQEAKETTGEGGIVSYEPIKDGRSFTRTITAVPTGVEETDVPAAGETGDSAKSVWTYTFDGNNGMAALPGVIKQNGKTYLVTYTAEQIQTPAYYFDASTKKETEDCIIHNLYFMTEEYYEAESPDTEVTVIWNDNENEKDIRPFTNKENASAFNKQEALKWFEENLQLTHTLHPVDRQVDPETNAVFYVPKETDESELLTENVPIQPTRIKTNESGSYWSYVFSDEESEHSTLPKYVKRNDKWYLVTYAVTQKEPPEGYVDQTQKARDTYAVNPAGVPTMTESPQLCIFNTLTTTYNATIEWRDNWNNYNTRAKNAQDYLNYIKFYQYNAGTQVSKATPTDEFQLAVKEEVTAKPDHDVYTISSSDLPMYTLQGTRYYYCIQQTEQINVTADLGGGNTVNATYNPVYDNTANNFANIKSYIYSGGTLTNTLIANKELTFYHEWKDGDQTPESRTGKSKIYLYRASQDHENNIKLTDSPVPTSIGMLTPIENGDVEIDGEKYYKFTYTYTHPKLDENGAEVKDEKGNTVMISDPLQVPVFDANGSLYVYYIREQISDDYVSQITRPTGETNKHLNITDTTEKGNYILNGGCYITRLEKKTTTTATKVFGIDAMQSINTSSLTNSNVLLSLQYQKQETDFKLTADDAGNLKSGDTIWYAKTDLGWTKTAAAPADQPESLTEKDGIFLYNGDKPFAKLDSGNYVRYQWQYIDLVEETENDKTYITFEDVQYEKRGDKFYRVGDHRGWPEVLTSTKVENIEYLQYKDEDNGETKDFAINIKNMLQIMNKEGADILPNTYRRAVLLTRFSAESLTDSETVDAPFYNEDGYPQEFRWVETYMRLMSHANEADLYDIDGLNGKLLIPDANEDDGGYTIVGPGIGNAPGERTTVKLQNKIITPENGNEYVANVLVGDIHITAKKVFNSSDNKEASAVISLYRDGSPINSEMASQYDDIFVENNTVYIKSSYYNDALTPAENIAQNLAYPVQQTLTAQTSDFHKEKKLYKATIESSEDLWTYLPRYDENGREYKYTVEETGVPAGYYMESLRYDNKIEEVDNPDAELCSPRLDKEIIVHEHANIVNRKEIVGIDPIRFYVEKKWLDGGDLNGRRDVELALVRVGAEDTTIKVNDGQEADGEPSYRELTLHQGDEAASVTLNAKNLWQEMISFYLPVGEELNQADYVVVEKSVGGITTEVYKELTEKRNAYKENASDKNKKALSDFLNSIQRKDILAQMDTVTALNSLTTDELYASYWIETTLNETSQEWKEIEKAWKDAQKSDKLTKANTLRDAVVSLQSYGALSRGRSVDDIFAKENPEAVYEAYWTSGGKSRGVHSTQQWKDLKEFWNAAKYSSGEKKTAEAELRTYLEKLKTDGYLKAESNIDDIMTLTEIEDVYDNYWEIDKTIKETKQWTDFVDCWNNTTAGRQEVNTLKKVLHKYQSKLLPLSGGSVLDILDQETLKNDFSIGAVGYDDIEKALENYYNVYSGTYERGGELYYTSVNQRTGLLNLNVTKHWIDGAQGMKPRLAVYRRTDLNGSSFYEQVDANKNENEDTKNPYVTITKSSGTIQPNKQYSYATLSRPDTDALTTNLTWNSTDYPKYDKNGNILHYLVREVDMAGESAQGNEVKYDIMNTVNGGIPSSFIESITGTDGNTYSVSITTNSINYSDDHESGDDYQIGITNRRTQNYPLSVNVVWRDNGTSSHTITDHTGTYDYDANELARPDIHIQLYRTTKADLLSYEMTRAEQEGNTPKLTAKSTQEEILHYVQSLTAAELAELVKNPSEDELGAVERITDTSNIWTKCNDWYWKCDLGEVQRYHQENGLPYIYFAVQEMRGNAANYGTSYYNTLKETNFGTSENSKYLYSEEITLSDGSTKEVNRTDYRPVETGAIKVQSTTAGVGATKETYSKTDEVEDTDEAFVPMPTVDPNRNYMDSADWKEEQPNWSSGTLILSDGEARNGSQYETSEEFAKNFSCTAVNYLRNIQKVNGHKVWMLSNGSFLDPRYMPDVYMKLYVSYRAGLTELDEVEEAEDCAYVGRTIASQTTNYDFSFPVENGKDGNEWNNTITLRQDEAAFTLKMDAVDAKGNHLLPQTDEWGRRLYYYMVEDFQNSVGEENPLFNTNYDKPKKLTSGDFAVTNTYQITPETENREFITINAKKFWEKSAYREPGTVTTYKLYAMWQDKNSNPITDTADCIARLDLKYDNSAIQEDGTVYQEIVFDKLNYTGSKIFGCLTPIHTHTNTCYGNLTCTKEEHTHSDSCMQNGECICGKEEHTHKKPQNGINSCYERTCEKEYHMHGKDCNKPIPYYAPNGLPYVFYIAEEEPGGYIVVSKVNSDGSAIEKITGSILDFFKKLFKLAAPDNVIDSFTTPNTVYKDEDGTEISEEEAAALAAQNKTVVKEHTTNGKEDFINTYKPRHFQLTLNKNWQDFNNIMETRPNGLTYQISAALRNKAGEEEQFTMTVKLTKGNDSKIQSEVTVAETTTGKKKEYISVSGNTVTVSNEAFEIDAEIKNNAQFDTNTWQLLLKNLPTYTPNSEPFYYTISEQNMDSDTKLENYTKIGKTISGASGTVVVDDISQTDSQQHQNSKNTERAVDYDNKVISAQLKLTKNLKTAIPDSDHSADSYSTMNPQEVLKNTIPMDELTLQKLVDMKVLPEKLTFVVQYKDEDTWKNMPWTEGDVNSHITVDGSEAIGGELETASILTNKTLEWELPVYRNNKERIVYRVIETSQKMQGERVIFEYNNVSIVGDDDTANTGMSFVQDNTVLQYASVDVTNAFTVYPMEIQKVWVDNDNQDASRPKSLELTMRYAPQNGAAAGNEQTTTFKLTERNVTKDNKAVYSTGIFYVPLDFNADNYIISEDDISAEDYSLKDDIGGWTIRLSNTTNWNETEKKFSVQMTNTLQDTYTAKQQKLTAVKTFVGDENWEKARPAKIVFRLYYRRSNTEEWMSVSELQNDKLPLNPTTERTHNFPTSEEAEKVVYENGQTKPAEWNVYQYWWKTANESFASDQVAMQYAVQEIAYAANDTEIYHTAVNPVGTHKIEASENKTNYVSSAKDNVERLLTSSSGMEGTVSNTLETSSLRLKKQWKDGEGNLLENQNDLMTMVDLELLPKTLSFQLFYKAQSDTEWTAAKENTGNETDEKKDVIRNFLTVAESNETPNLFDGITWDGLPKYDQNGQPMQYQLRELGGTYKTPVIQTLGPDLPPTEVKFPYKASGDDPTATVNETIIRENVIHLRSMSATKVWNDEDNRDMKRPEDVVLALYRDGKLFDKINFGMTDKNTLFHTVDAENQTVIWKNIPVYRKDGETQSDYQVYEIKNGTETLLQEGEKDSDYQVSYNPNGTVNLPNAPDAAPQTIVTNTYTPKRITVTAGKVWRDFNVNTYRTDVTVELQYKTETDTWEKVPLGTLTNNTYPDGKVYTTSENPQTIKKDAAASELAQWENLPAYVKIGDTNQAVVYRVIETTSVDGYKTVNSSTTASYTPPSVTEPQTYDLSVTNVEYGFELVKELRSGAGTNNTASFDLYEINTTIDGTTTETKINNTSLQTNAEGTLSITPTVLSGTGSHRFFKPNQKYKLVETTAPAGYRLPEMPLYFTLKEDGSIEPEQGTSPTYAVGKQTDDYGVNRSTVTVTDDPISLKLHKTALDDKPLNGARFTVSGNYVNPEATEITGVTYNENHVLGTFSDSTFTPLDGRWKEGETYTFTETTAPAGYELKSYQNNSISFKVTVNANNEITVSDSVQIKNTNETAAAVDAATKEAAETVRVKNVPIDIQLNKWNENHSTALSGAKFRLEPEGQSAFALTTAPAGANYSIQAEDGKPYVELTMTEGTISLPSALLKYGNTYRLTELVAPDGYKSAENGKQNTFTFKVEQNGTVSDIDPSDGIASVMTPSGTAQTVGIDVKNAFIPAKTLLKYDADSKSGLPNVTFTLTPADGYAFASTASTVTGTGINYTAAAEGAKPYFILTTQKDGKVVIPTGILKQDQVYALTETVNPNDGYLFEKNDIVFTTYFKVRSDGTLVRVVKNDSKQWTEPIGGTSAFTFENPANQISMYNKPLDISLIKIDAALSLEQITEETQTITASEATFELYKSTDNGATWGDTPIAAKTTSQGKLSFTGTDLSEKFSFAENTKYKLVETVAPQGYEVASPLIFTISQNGSVLIDSSSEYVVKHQTGEESDILAVKDKQITMKLKKVAPDGNVIADRGDASFKVTPASGSAFASGKTVPAGGKIVTVSNIETELAGWLVAGNTYLFEEQEAPTGYEQQTGNKAVSFTVTVDENGNITVDNSDELTNTAGTIYPAAISAGTTASAAERETVTVTNIPIEVRIHKTDNLNGADLAGAVFELTESGQTNVLGTFTTGENGIVDITSALVAYRKTYVLTETTAPAGYESSISGADSHKSITFSVNRNGTVTYDSTTDTTISVTDEIIRARIYKYDTDNGKKNPLSGIELELKPANGSAFANTTESPVKLTTAADGYIDIPDGLLREGNSYILKETKGNPSYQLSDDEHYQLTFRVGNDGKLIPDSTTNSGIYTVASTSTERQKGTETLTVSTEQINVENIRTEFQIAKYAHDAALGDDRKNDVPLTGAKLTLYRVNDDASETEIETWTSETEPKKFIGQPAGTYRLVENVSESEYGSPYGYLTADPITFELKQDNSIEILTPYDEKQASVSHNKKDGESLINAVYTLRMTDTKIRGHFSIEKQMENVTASIGSAEFDLYQQQANGSAVKIASNLKTSTGSGWSSQNNTAVFTEGTAQTQFKYGLPAGDYYLIEVFAPDGGRLPDGSIEDTYNKGYKVNGTDTPTDQVGKEVRYEFSITSKDKDKVPAKQQPDDTNLTIVNTKFEASFNLLKTDAEDNNKPIDGVTFALTRMDTKPEEGAEYQPVKLKQNAETGAYCVSEETDASNMVVTAKDGKLKVEGLIKGQYRLKEIGVPTGSPYSAGKTYWFTIEDKDYGKENNLLITRNEDGSETAELSTDVFQLPTDKLKTNNSITNFRNSITLNKKLSGGTILAGAQFKVEYIKRNADNSIQVQPFTATVVTETEDGKHSTTTEQPVTELFCTTDKNGSFRLDNLPEGEYRITELSTQSGYQLLKEPIYVKLPMVLTYEQIGDTKVNTDYAWRNTNNTADDKTDDTWYFSHVTYDVTNTANFKMPQAGADKWLDRLIAMACVIALSCAMYYLLFRKKRNEE